jgi:mono/diheme cytochrome c family protein
VRDVIAAAAFIIGFIIVGGTVLFLAFSGGPQGVRDQLHAGQSRGGRRAFFTIAGLLVLAFGVAIPGLVIAHNNDSQSRQARGGVDLSDAQQDGRKLFARNCSTCHTLGAANAVGKVGPNLDQLKGINAGLVKNAIEVGRARGMGQMPAQLLTGEDVNKVASFVAATAGR